MTKLEELKAVLDAADAAYEHAADTYAETYAAYGSGYGYAS